MSYKINLPGFRKNLRAGRMKVESMHHLDLRVTNHRKSVSFYNGILRPLGFRTMGVRGEVVTYYLKGPTCLGIRPVKKSSQRDISYSDKKAGIRHFAISVKSKSDVDEFYRLLRRKHVRILYPPQEYSRYSRGYYSVFFLDPDGIDVEVSHGTYNIPGRKDATYDQQGTERIRARMTAHVRARFRSIRANQTQFYQIRSMSIWSRVALPVDDAERELCLYVPVNWGPNPTPRTTTP